MPEELLLIALVKRALKDAKDRRERLCEEAACWLWTVAPTIAERAGVTQLSIIWHY
jgi:hypothetical protein